MSQARSTLLREALSDSAIGFARDEHGHPAEQHLSRWTAMILWLAGCGALWGLIALVAGVV